MSIEMEFEGLDELIKRVESLATETQVESINKKILKECGELAYSTVKPLIHESDNNSNSGRRGSRPSGHARDNVPKPKLRKKGGRVYVVVGWEKSDKSPYYYMKMEEWGTSQRPPHHSFGLVNKMLKKKYDDIAKKEYEKLIRKLEG
ncbi:HK97-gp10 family putative phage morphogenesis protein [Paraclostridium sordellii]|uniref:HK97-gp10 family putative phage morphogenesis protein n=1 Tax=Paraclostridium sordellii TaxID=1505 RepID=UPI0005DD3562|nr:HK97-gp10 family putative phage morphogenesis protein [Paeniclostridium sordellii]MDK0695983.1 HK97 gp10 family phage protein [Clostridium perfringens]MDU1456227.1 HK97 gp10 family phage protein [Paeniclostridium sordellii]CEN29827.1 HK97 family phage protein [[Clostridium] sordellii] [Paeniclostridium sordellii]CEN30382.1 HK97 family phage protein [[Clostridium] sordellii] [Paeniclostridium sordellii]CEP42280.1 HK97 family phage protein [[Clostridium] sordellii] [Paeniclostridium sordellii